MELIIAALAQQIVPVIGAVIAALATYGISILKEKTKVDGAKKALDHVDQVVHTVVGGLSQTVAEQLKSATADGKLSETDAKNLKAAAIDKTMSLLSETVVTAAARTVPDLQDYIASKIEERVLSLKK
jgi:aspartokinase-like uncharacterized kinase